MLKFHLVHPNHSFQIKNFDVYQIDKLNLKHFYTILFYLIYLNLYLQ